MTTELAKVIGRLAIYSAVLRSRAQDIARADVNGGSAAELRSRIYIVVARLEQVADELEKAIA